MTTPLAPLLDAVRALHKKTPELRAFLPWPQDLVWAELVPQTLPVLREIAMLPVPDGSTGPVLAALQQVQEAGHWVQTYAESQVGTDFLRRYGYIELIGPSGQYTSQQMRAFVGYWGPGLRYDWHWHAAEEIYYTPAGQAHFIAEDLPDADAPIGASRVHAAWQRHAMETRDHPYLTLAFWRGADVAEPARMVAP